MADLALLGVEGLTGGTNLPFFFVKVHANRTQLILSGGPASILRLLVVLGRIPSTASLPPFCSAGLLLSLLTGGGGRGGRLFLLSDFEPRSIWNSPPEPSALMENVSGVPVITGVVAVGVADDNGESETAANSCY